MQRRFTGLGSQKPFIVTVDTTQVGTSGIDQFTIPTRAGFNYNYRIKTDGLDVSGITGDYTITFPSGSGVYDVEITGTFPTFYFKNTGDRLKITEVKQWGLYPNSGNQDFVFYGCSNLVITASDLGLFGSVISFSSAYRDNTSFTTFPLIDTSSAVSLRSAWQGNSNLISFPLINTSNVTDFFVTWVNNTSLTSFPLIDTSSGTGFFGTWANNTSLTSFPLIDTSSGTSFQATWANNTSLTSFPLIDTSSATSLISTWQGCTSLANFSANTFNNTLCTNFQNAFANTNLTQASIDNVLVSINGNGTSNGIFNQSGGSAPSVIGETAITAMRSRGWTITVTGGF